MHEPNESVNRDPQTPTVYLVDDDVAFGEWVTTILESVSLSVRHFTRPSDFLAEFSPDLVGCIVLDVRLPEMSGVELFKRLQASGSRTPVLMITAYGEVSIAVEALKAGAADFIQKPISAQALLDRIQRALKVAHDRAEVFDKLSHIESLMVTLSPRENEVLELLLEGKNTKQISSSLGVGLTTIDFHRKNVLEKMRVETVVELARLVDHYEQLQRAVQE